MKFDAEFEFAKNQNFHVEGGGGGGRGGSQNLMLSSNLLKSKIPILRGGLTEFDAEFKFAKNQNSHVEVGGGGGSWNLMLSSNWLKSKIPMLGGGLQNLMLSSNLLKSKIPMLRGGGLMEYDAESKFAKKKNIFAKNFLSFRTKIGTVLLWTLSTKWFPYTKYRRTTINYFQCIYRTLEINVHRITLCLSKL